MADESERVRSIFLAAIEQHAPAGWPGFLDEACAQEPAIRGRVERLLRAQVQLGDFNEKLKPGRVGSLDEPLTEQPGTVIGPYKLLEQIGEGGFGVVFMAEQEKPLRRKVALKVLKPGMDTRQVVARFEAERQALALMDHTNIAKIHDAGTTYSGRPYFVMELVRGVPITDFCDQRRLTPRERLELFVLVCQAIQHAHQKGIIHRDLKPSNVLVTLHDTVAVPKVIDFGIAKATGQKLTERTLFTQFAQMVGTPLYMSPEQAELNGLDVDTRSDVYALGVLLYELLTGTTPFESETLKKVGYDEMRRIIREEEPPTPSQRLSTLEAKACSTVSERRRVDERRLGQILLGELDWIVMKALEKDRNRRYESASAFAADVQRYLDDEAVEACPPSVGYRLRKYWRRNQRALVMAGLFAAVLMAATVVSVWQAVRARDAERTAATEADIARAVNSFLQEDLLGQAASAPEASQEFGSNSNLTVREALSRASARIGQRFQDQPLVEAAIRTTIGAAFASLDEFQLAAPHLERAVALRQTHLGPNHPDTRSSMHHLVDVYEGMGRFSDAIGLQQQILEHRIAVLGPDHPETLAQTSRLAVIHRSAGQWGTSVPLLERVLEKQRTICGPRHPNTLRTMHALAMNYTYVDRFADSISLHAKILELRDAANDPEQRVSRFFLMTFAVACEGAGKFDQADGLLREMLHQDRKRDDSLGQIITASSLGWLSRNLILQQRYGEAEPLLREGLAIFEHERPNDYRRFYWVSQLGGVLLGRERYGEAEPLLVQGYEGMKQNEATMHGNWRRRLAEAGERVVRFYEVTNQPDKARLWREKLQSSSRPE